MEKSLQPNDSDTNKQFKELVSKMSGMKISDDIDFYLQSLDDIELLSETLLQMTHHFGLESTYQHIPQPLITQLFDKIVGNISNDDILYLSATLVFIFLTIFKSAFFTSISEIISKSIKSTKCSIHSSSLVPIYKRFFSADIKEKDIKNVFYPKNKPQRVIFLSSCSWNPLLNQSEMNQLIEAITQYLSGMNDVKTFNTFPLIFPLKFIRKIYSLTSDTSLSGKSISMCSIFLSNISKQIFSCELNKLSLSFVQLFSSLLLKHDFITKICMSDEFVLYFNHLLRTVTSERLLNNKFKYQLVLSIVVLCINACERSDEFVFKFIRLVYIEADSSNSFVSLEMDDVLAYIGCLDEYSEDSITSLHSIFVAIQKLSNSDSSIASNSPTYLNDLSDPTKSEIVFDSSTSPTSFQELSQPSQQDLLMIVKEDAHKNLFVGYLSFLFGILVEKINMKSLFADKMNFAMIRENVQRLKIFHKQAKHEHFGHEQFSRISTILSNLDSFIN